MGQLGFTSSRADPDVWSRLLKRTTGEEYYKYVLLYVNEMLVISENAESVLRKEIEQHSPLAFQGGTLREVTLENGVKAWAFGSCQYVQSAVCNIEDRHAKAGEKLPYKAPTPLPVGITQKLS